MSRFLALYLGGILVLVLFTFNHSGAVGRPTPVKHISIADVRGKRLDSLFYGLPSDKHYAALRNRLDQRQQHSTCRAQPTAFEQALAVLGLASTVVHAQTECYWECGQDGCNIAPEDESCPGTGCTGTFTFGYYPYEGRGTQSVGNQCAGGQQCFNCEAESCETCSY
jgi:hypothetical protein